MATRPGLLALWLVLMASASHLLGLGALDARRFTPDINFEFNEGLQRHLTPRSDKSLARALGCVRQFHAMASQLLDGHERLAFPMHCCLVEPFAQTCRAHANDRAELNSALRRSAAHSPLRQWANVTCSHKCLVSCCTPVNPTAAANSSNSEDKDEGGGEGGGGGCGTHERTARELLVRAAERQLFQCTWDFIQNLIKLQFKIPAPCCKLPIIKILCGMGG